MKNIKCLNYGELVNPKRAVKILSPNEIPVHPMVYTSDYNQEFVEEVSESVPKSLRKDIKEIERVLGIKLNMEISEKGIIYKGDELVFEDVDSYVGSKGQSIEVQYVSSNIALDKRKGFETKLQLDGSHPMPIKRLKEYSFDPDSKDLEIPVWYVHNHLDNGLPLELYFRNFAIMFNNLGVKKL